FFIVSANLRYNGVLSAAEIRSFSCIINWVCACSISVFPDLKFPFSILLQGLTTTHENGVPAQFRDPPRGCRLLPARRKARLSPPPPCPPSWRVAGAVRQARLIKYTRFRGYF